jgi:hypothetical protein
MHPSNLGQDYLSLVSALPTSGLCHKIVNHR